LRQLPAEDDVDDPILVPDSREGVMLLHEDARTLPARDDYDLAPRVVGRDEGCHGCPVSAAGRYSPRVLHLVATVCVR
jgi:hypothetical protein